MVLQGGGALGAYQAGVFQGLEEEGYAVDVAYDGEEANFKASTVEYDAIVLDIMLPKVDGLTLLQRWRKAGNPYLETVCAENNVDVFYTNLVPIPQAKKADF